MKLHHFLGTTSFIWKSCKCKLYSPFILLPFYFLPRRIKFFPDLFFNNGDVMLSKFPSTWHMQSCEFWNRSVSIPESTPFYMLLTYHEQFSVMGWNREILCCHLIFILSYLRSRANTIPRNRNLLTHSYSWCASMILPMNISFVVEPCQSISNQKNVIAIQIDSHMQRGLHVNTLAWDVSSLDWT